MPRKIAILESAKDEFAEVKHHVKKEFGESAWNAVNAEYKQALHRIKNHPEMGNPIDALRELGTTNIRYGLVRQTRIVYEYDEKLVLIHMFIHTRRDFRTHLLKRLFAYGGST